VLRIELEVISSIIGIIIFLAASYIFGLLASRAGSVILEPIVEKCFKGQIKRAPYEDFCYAESQDAKITILAQYRDLYRTMVVVGAYTLVVLTFEATQNSSSIIEALVWVSLCCIVVFFLAYKKQSIYVTKRVKFIKKQKNKVSN